MSFENTISKGYATEVRISDRIVTLSFCIWLLLLVSNYHTLVTYYDRDGYSVDIRALISGFLLFVISVFSNLFIFSHRATFRVNRVSYLLLLFFVWSFITTFWSISQNETTIQSTFAILAIFPLVYAADIILRSKRALELGAWLFLLYVLFLCFTLEVRLGVTVGGIQPNQFAKLGLVMMTLAFLAESKSRALFFFVALACVAITTSRGGVLYLLVFSLIYYRYLFTIRRIVIFTFSICIIIPAISLVGYLLSFDIFRFVYSDILLVDSDVYGIGSGLTGRTEHWEQGLQVIGLNPLFGYGYGTRLAPGYDNPLFASAHSGYLNLLLDTGLIGGALFLSALIIFIIERRRHFATTERAPGQERTVVATVVAYAVIMVIDPTYISFAFPPSILFLLCLLSSHKNFGTETEISFSEKSSA